MASYSCATGSTDAPGCRCPGKGALDLMGVKVRSILRAAGIDPAITFTSFRHGGLTELGDADLTDAQIRAVSRHKSPRVLTRYVKRTEKQIVEATKKRRAVRPASLGNVKREGL